MKDQIPKLTLLMPAYNEETYIKQSIRCVLENSYRDCQLIIADNASTDRTQDHILEIIESNTSGIPIEYIRREQNIGSWANLNDLIKRAKGEYLCFMGTHDLVSKDYFLQLVNLLEKDKNAVLSFAKPQCIDKNNDYIKTDSIAHDLNMEVAVVRFLSLMYLTPYHLYGVMRRDAVMKTHLFHQIIGADNVFLLELSQQGTFLLCPKERWFDRENRGKEDIISRYRRYKKALFSSRWESFRFSFFPDVLLLFHHMALPFTIRGINMKRRLALVSIYPLIVISCVNRIKFNIRNFGKW